jgi:hypothetical protein
MQADEKLTKAEIAVVEAAGQGSSVDLRVGDSEVDDPARGAAWDASRTVRAELLIALLTGDRVPESGRLRSVKLRGARISGTLDLGAATIGCPLKLQDCYVDEPVNLREATAATIRMPGCHVPALIADQVQTTGDLELNYWFTASEGVSLGRARIGGQLDLSNAKLKSPSPRGLALAADELTVGQSMLMIGTAVDGGVSITGAHVAGELNLSDAKIETRRGPALQASALVVDRDMTCEGGFAAVGEVLLVGARVGGSLSFADAQLYNPQGMCLHADALTVGQGMFCQREFSAQGEVCLHLASIRGALSFTNATLTSSHTCLTLRGTSADVLYLMPREPPKGLVDLTNAQVGTFYDDQATWPAKLSLRGFAYDSLEDQDANVRDRLEWLKRDPDGYTPQIYDQLGAAYRRAGNALAARKIAIAKQRRRRSRLAPLNWVWYLTVGYGYRTWWASIWLAALITVGTVIFGRAYPAQMIATGGHPPAFHAVGYTIDVLVPIVNLGEKSGWQPEGTALYWSWILTLAGWTLTTAVVAGLTGILKRD